MYPCPLQGGERRDGVPWQVQLQGICCALLLFLHHSPCVGRPCLTPVILPQIIVSTGISYGVNLNDKFGISVVGNIPSG